ncbi:quinolinate synthase NadA [Clostridium guangxiense]|uniref:quinolinate synthase NadA n=1 Tax=Clostridium guangxiense TaxID=1662055 RepID=UPI001E4FCB3B|nr:quinolinate synthase NadA [Clostridium guangxiense]MCD2346517.1 quinolinate synthase NadA [Clostridium guangxiense]
MIENLEDKILELKSKRNAIILSHYYQSQEIQEMADFIGDSYELSKIAKKNSADVIVLCGVKFMAESAKILSPDKKVILPAINAGCPMADMANANGLKKLKSEHKNAKVVCYINSSVEVKALSDACCTSSNAVKIVKNIDSKDIIFLPDKNLGSYVKEQVPDKNIILWNGFCRVHDMVKPEDIIEVQKLKKNLKVLVHPECSYDVRCLADFIGSTAAMIKYVNKDKDTFEYLIVTETGIMYKMRETNPDKKFYTLNKMICVNMKATKLEDIYFSLKNMTNEINIEENVRKKAFDALNNMLILGR